MKNLYPVKVIGTNWQTTYAKVKVGHHSAYTKINPRWKWWKPWIKRFVSVPEGWDMTFRIGGTIDLAEKPKWATTD